MNSKEETPEPSSDSYTTSCSSSSSSSSSHQSQSSTSGSWICQSGHTNEGSSVTCQVTACPHLRHLSKATGRPRMRATASARIPQYQDEGEPSNPISIGGIPSRPSSNPDPDRTRRSPRGQEQEGDEEEEGMCKPKSRHYTSGEDEYEASLFDGRASSSSEIYSRESSVNKDGGSGSAITPMVAARSRGIQRIGPYVIGSRIGKGTSSHVRLGFHKDSAQQVAIKIVSKNFLQNDELFLKLQKEVALQRLLDHQAVVRLYGVYETKGHIFLITEYMSGGELFREINRRGAFRLSDALRVFQEIIAALEYCHANLICHRDLKPENILISDEGRIKIADFGLSTLMNDRPLGTACGSPHYVAPEVIKGNTYDGFKSDIWSAGVLLYALLTGSLPFDDKDMMRLLEKVVLGRFAIPRYLPDDAKDLLRRMLNVNPEKRITLEGIKGHAFFLSQKPPYPLPKIASLHERIPSVQLLRPSEVLDKDAILILQILGLADSESDAITKLLSPTPSLIHVYYRQYELAKKYELNVPPNKQRGQTSQSLDFNSYMPVSRASVSPSLVAPKPEVGRSPRVPLDSPETSPNKSPKRSPSPTQKGLSGFALHGYTPSVSVKEALIQKFKEMQVNTKDAGDIIECNRESLHFTVSIEQSGKKIQRRKKSLSLLGKRIKFYSARKFASPPPPPDESQPMTWLWFKLQSGDPFLWQQFSNILKEAIHIQEGTLLI